MTFSRWLLHIVVPKLADQKWITYHSSLWVQDRIWKTWRERWMKRTERERESQEDPWFQCDSMMMMNMINLTLSLSLSLYIYIYLQIMKCLIRLFNVEIIFRAILWLPENFCLIQIFVIIKYLQLTIYNQYK